MPLNRRTVLESVGTIGAMLTITGLATANDGRARYVVTANEQAEREIHAAGYEVLNGLADGSVLLVAGPEGADTDLKRTKGVSKVVRDIDVEREAPALEKAADVDTGSKVDQVYDRYLWDKQRQQVRAAHDYATGAGRTVAVLDTGVDDSHPDLKVDIENSAVIKDGRPEPHDGPRGGAHGTHVAGTIAGTGDVGMLGTAPDATIVSIRVLGPETGTIGDLLVAMEYAAEVGVDVANLSFGTDPIPPQENARQYRRLLQSVTNSVTRRGTLLVSSAGNSGVDLQKGGNFTLPSSLAGVLTVSASAPNDRLSFYSNYGTNEIDISAPGGGYETLEKTFTSDSTAVEWLYPFNLTFSTHPVSDDGEAQYGWRRGTSMAAAQVSGLAALTREVAPGATARQVQNAIQQAAEGEPGRSDPGLGAGRANALATVERLQ